MPLSLITIFFIAFGLAMDAFAVSVASGITIKNLSARSALRISFSFGLFQAIMPLIGWFAGLSLFKHISPIDHWVAFGLLVLIGCKMIYESFKIERIEEEQKSMETHVLLILSIATSIDALAVGLSFGILGTRIVKPIVIIGIVTFVLSFLGVFIGKRMGHFFEKRIEMLGGLILIGIGALILFRHLTQNR